MQEVERSDLKWRVEWGEGNEIKNGILWIEANDDGDDDDDVFVF